MLSRNFGFAFLLVVCCAFPVFAGDDLPGWLQQASQIKTPAYDKDIQAVVLLNDQQVKVSADGRITTVRTYAIRILTREGREYASAAIPYLTDSGKVEEMKAWLIKPTGEIRRFGKDDIVDVISDPNDIYNELRVKLISATDSADAGAVFGYQATSQEKSIFGEDVFHFQNRLPALTSRYSLILPSDWSATSITFNHPEIKPQVTGSSYVWQLNELAPIKDEPASPKVPNLVPRLAISYVAPQGGSGPLRTFANWVDVSKFLSEIQDPQSTPDEAIAAKARELTANAKTEFEKIRVIGDYVQHLKYISIDIGVGRGGGLRPHAATEVFAKSYGDCKDKANLMRAMLKTLNITAYPVGIYSGDRTFVREEWASPTQFNHCIVAVKVSAETQSPTVIDHPKLGRLLIFDATDDDTPLGELPDDEQGSFALIVAGDSGGLMKMPVSLPEVNGIKREITASIGGDGFLTAKVKESATGTSAVDYRAEFRHTSRPDYLKTIEGWVSRGANGAKVSRVDPRDRNVGDNFALDIDFSAPAYGQLMQNRLLVFKPAIISRRDSLFLTDPKRQYPIVLDSLAFAETVRLTLPEGFSVDELPDAVKLETPFGTYQTTYEIKGSELIFTRKMSQRAATIPPDQYQGVRSFYERIRAAEQSPVVLARK
jgi:hypothetical protein